MWWRRKQVRSGDRSSRCKQWLTRMKTFNMSRNGLKKQIAYPKTMRVYAARIIFPSHGNNYGRLDQHDTGPWV